MKNHLSASLSAIAFSALFAACAPANFGHVHRSIACIWTVASTMGPVPAATALRLGRELHWARNSAEHRAVYLEVYRAGGDRLVTLAAGRAPGSWGVILDADETVIDNSEYERRRAPYGGSFDSTAWDGWVNEAAATALPGAAEFTARVRSMGGKVVIVTNRDDRLCGPTRTNLQRVGIQTDLVLCRTGTGDKNPRFHAVASGTAAPGFPAITVLEWFGDNIQDFPDLTQAVRSGGDAAFARFGDTYFALPNAMYGSWESNPQQ